ncbi:hypothetical protein LBWT_X0350 (plasmid) [Leptolyngbya boryana IAM M-101]|uniref:hypothetical protein n=1 Tax=Leptolyngbya boryana TaxID=1184 RepID=UPI000360D824|nr:hypothetical protein [Leptolyngbya boryana]BAS59963.1 hypothetical protein LBWT_X0350 [Leptolyngbya boryana IAM M-101]BAS66311.1 hypothetical protein LBDG_X0350 [Leptolyngbya boryana dg5]
MGELRGAVTLNIPQAKSSTGTAQIWEILQSQMPSIEQFSQHMIADQSEPVQRFFYMRSRSLISFT